ncbi:hypothetical protein ACJ41O_002113 [Fusarium nematophilum]
MDTTAHRPPSRKRGDRVFKTKSCELPRLRDLRLELGYGIRGQKKDIDFKKAVRAQVEGFVSSDNIPGLRFTKWKTPEHQRGLLEMTKDFLDTKGKGIEFWPDESSSPNKRPLEYAKDSVQIKRLMTKVFYREVKEYKRKPSQNSTIHEPTQVLGNSPIQKDGLPSQPEKPGSSALRNTQDSRGQSVDNPIDVENMGSTTGFPGQSTDVDPFAATGMAFTFDRFMHGDLPDGLPATPGPFGTTVFELPGDVQTKANTESHNEIANAGAGNISTVDPYEVPTTPNGGTPVDQNRGKRPAQPDPSENSDRSKAPRREPDAPAERTNQAASNSSAPPGQKKKRRPRQTLEKTRFSSRERKQTQRPGFAREKTVEAAMRTQICSSDEDSDAEPHQRQQRRKNGPVPKGAARRGKPPAPAPQNPAGRTAEEPNRPEVQPSGNSPSTQGRPGGVEPQGGPSTGGHSEQRQNDRARQDTNGARAEHTGADRDSVERPAGSIELRDQEREAIAASSFTFFKSHNGIDFLDWAPSSSFFQMSLSHLAGELALRGSYSGLSMRLATPDHTWQQDVELGNESKFAIIKSGFVRKIRNAHQSAFVASTNVPVLNFEVHIWPQRA